MSSRKPDLEYDIGALNAGLGHDRVDNERILENMLPDVLI